MRGRNQDLQAAADPVPAVAAEDPASSSAASTRRGFTFRANLITGVCALVLLTGLSVILVISSSYRKTSAALANDLFGKASDHAVTQARAFVLRAVPLAETLGELAGNGLELSDSDALARQLTDVLSANPGLTWISYGDESGNFTGAYRPADSQHLRVNQSRIVNGATKLVEHDVLEDGTWQVFRREEDTGYDPRQRPFYQKAKAAERLVWLEPYVFYDQGGPGVTCARPVYRDGALRGVLTVDFDLATLSRFVATLTVSPNSRFFLFTPDGDVLACPGADTVTQSDDAPDRLLQLKEVDDPAIRAFRQNLLPTDLVPRQSPPDAGVESAVRLASSGDSRQFSFKDGDHEYFASVHAFWVGADLPWIVGAVAPAEDFLGEVWRTRTLALLIAGIAVAIALLLAAWLARCVSGPVESLVGLMRRVGEGDLDARAELGGSREFRELTSALNRMIGDLRDRLRLRYSLAVATDVQQRLLPNTPPDVPGLQIAGHSTYCDQTGGDYYDFLLVDRSAPHTLMVCIGDVMGHGVAAALVMAGARAVLRDRAAQEGGLAHLLGRINTLLVSDLGGSRFMTMHLSVIDARAGTFRWAAAGHDPAIIYEPNRDMFIEVDEGDLPLGIDESGTYGEHTYGPLAPGAVIVIGTDGVWETRNDRGELFGKDRLRDLMRSCAAAPAKDIASAIVNNLNVFRGEEDRLDDVTFVVLKYTGVLAQFIPESSIHISRPTDGPDDLPGANNPRI